MVLLAASALTSFVLCSLFNHASAACNINGGSWVKQSAVRAVFPRTDSRVGYDCSFKKDKSYLRYTWQAPGCRIASVANNPEAFLRLLSGKKMLIVGDSMATNTYTALAWAMPTSLLSGPPSDTDFLSPRYRASVSRVWTNYFVAKQKGVSNCFLDQVDMAWAGQLRSADYIVFNGFHHFFHKDVRFFKKGKLLQNYSPLQAISDAATFVRNYLQKHGYRGRAFVLTYSPAHPGKVCPKAVAPWATTPGGGDYLAVTNTLYKVFGSAGSNFKIVDIYRLSQSRPDAHVGSGSSTGGFPSSARGDCSHWCVPGLPNTWVDLLFSSMLNSI